MTHDTGLTTAPRWTAGEDATLVRLRAEGQSARQIGQVLGRTHRAVHTRADKLLAVAPNPSGSVAAQPPHGETMDAQGRRAWTPEDDVRLAALRTQGMEDAAIGAALGRTTSAVTKRVCSLRARGDDIPSRKRPSQWTPERVAEARAMRTEGLTPNQIAHRLGTDAATVGRALRSPETTEDSPGEGVRVGRTVPDHTRTALALADARAALTRAQARHREAMEAILGPMREAMLEAGLVGLPTGDDEDDPACRLVDHLRRRGVELRRVA